MTKTEYINLVKKYLGWKDVHFNDRYGPELFRSVALDLWCLNLENNSEIEALTNFTRNQLISLKKYGKSIPFE